MSDAVFSPTGLSPTPEQLAIQLDRRRHVIVEANAGAAKTTTLALRLAQALVRGAEVDRILVLTYTEAAVTAVKQALQRIGLGLGADVPIFIHGCNAFAEGVGERFTDVDLPPAWYLVLVPPLGVPTPEIFRSPRLRRDTPPIAAADWRPGFGCNDLETVACSLYPEIARHLDWLRTHGDARMSGSGACCFVGFDDQRAAHAALASLPADMKGFVAAGLDRHPLGPVVAA